MLTRIQRKIWTTLRGEESWIRRTGNFRTREFYGVISRAHYLYGMLRAADLAKFCGKTRATVVEFGVASGTGLLNMVELAGLIRSETGVDLRIVGFDTGHGLPAVEGYKDHPELWRTGDFFMEDRDALLRKLDGRAEVIWGDIATTIGPFVQALDAAAPLGFVSVDVDIYTAAKAALQCFDGPPEKYNPGVSIYFDDVSFFFANEWAGELLAIAEFNGEHDLRKIGPDRSLPGRRPLPAAGWYNAMYVGQILDHDIRQKPRERPQYTIGSHIDYLASQFLF